MNIFDTTTGFFGEHKKGELKELSNSFWNTAREIRSELGEDTYILDAYLSEIFTALDSVLISNITNEADNMMSKIYFLCKNITECEAVKLKDNFYEVVHNYIVAHPLSYKESETRFKLYLVSLIDEFTDIYIEKIYHEINLDSVVNYNSDIIKENFRKISNKIGENKMENLNRIIVKRFTIPTILDVFKRTITRNLFGYLLSKDEHTSKQIFQIILQQSNSF